MQFVPAQEALRDQVASLLDLFPSIGQHVPAAIAVDGAALLRTLHAQGAQIYEAKANAEGKLEYGYVMYTTLMWILAMLCVMILRRWVFREPIASLMQGGNTVGRHYKGPHWEVDGDQSTVHGRVLANVPSAQSGHIPLLKLEVRSMLRCLCVCVCVCLCMTI
jgi:hypothetical protein